LNFLLIYC